VCIIVVQLAADPEIVTMDGPGSDTRAGYEEKLIAFLGMKTSDAIPFESYVTEAPRLRQIRGHCE
jgi:hypothetical protein